MVFGNLDMSETEQQATSVIVTHVKANSDVLHALHA